MTMCSKEEQLKIDLTYLTMKDVINHNENNTYSLTEKTRFCIEHNLKTERKAKAFTHAVMMLTGDFLYAEDITRYVKVLQAIYYWKPEKAD